MQLSQSTTAGIIARLENKRLITKTLDKDDARKTFLTPTEEGLLLETPLKKIAMETQQTLVEGMTEEEQEELIRLLQIALNNMNQIRTRKGL